MIFTTKNQTLNRTTEIVIIKATEEVPSIDAIRLIPREKILKLVFDPLMQKQRLTIGEDLKRKLKGFQVGIHTIEPEINISKLITDEEIEANQDFLEKCAKEYRELSKELIYKVVDKLKITINPEFPLLTFNSIKGDKRQIGKVDDWRYYLHGFHCGFENLKTGQLVETPLIFGLEFGDLDPYFFSRFIKSTPEYQPLKIDIYEDYADGVQINQKMLSLGKFERITSNIENLFGVVVTDRDKIEVNVYQAEPIQTEKQKFNLWRFLKLK